MKQSLDIKNVTKSERKGSHYVNRFEVRSCDASSCIKNPLGTRIRNLLKKKQLIAHHRRQEPEHSSWSSSKGGRKREKRRKPEAKLKKRVRQKKEVPRPKKSVSKPLMDTLWARFKSRIRPTAKDCHLLSFQFSLTDKQISQWFLEKKKKYQEEKLSLQQSKQKKQDLGGADPPC